MIYYGARSSRYYLHALEQCRRGSSPHEIVSVAGGMAFLHAIGPLTKKVYLVDVDSDTIEFSRNIFRVMVDLPTRQEFMEHLKLTLPKDSTVFGEHGLKTGKFYWHDGSYNFASDEHYIMLRRKVQNMPVDFSCGSLSEFNYRNLEFPSNVLVSNADGPLGVDGDKILPQILRTTILPITYISWLYTIQVNPNIYKHSYDDHCDL